MSPPGVPLPTIREVLTEQQTNNHHISCRSQEEAKGHGIRLTLQQPLQRSRNRYRATTSAGTAAVEIVVARTVYRAYCYPAAGFLLWVYLQLMQQRARKAAVRAMATVCAAIPKPDLRDPDLLGADIKKTARQLENGVWILDLPLQAGVCGVTAASPDAWQQLQHIEVIASLRRRTGAGFVLRGSALQQQQPQQQQQTPQGVYVRVVGEDQETVFRGAVAAWSCLGPPQYLPAPADAADDETFDCATAMAGENDEFLKDVCQRTGALIDIEPDQPQGYAHGGAERTGLRYVARACTQGATEKALRLLRWRLHPQATEEDGESPSPGQDIRGAAAASFWQSAMPDEAEMMRRRKEAEERRKKRGQRSRSASPERRGPNRLSFAPPPDELLTGPYAPLDK
ncbi:uncharacterized protein EMH_0058570 [Eimeria mitis]|uniref:Uncharacterized protein n=1 Tax=Eimeria mitis TaxID=44415 RepID=U6KHG8_9EIME|nr:uncharacterized protein EMH_0058570 [Eimeria mitis]CDJ36241.1 hypothetical protein, conserved [Eimeria mitis]